MSRLVSPRRVTLPAGSPSGPRPRLAQRLFGLKDRPLARRCLLAGARLLDWLNGVVPKDGRRVLFYDSARDFLDDNTEALYSWMRAHGYGKKYRLSVCVPRQREPLPLSGYEPAGMLGGLWAYLRSKYVFYSFGDFRIRPSKGQVVVNQWHGTPLKTIGKLTGYKAYTGAGERLDCFTYVLAASEAFRPVFARAFGCGESRVKVLGHARIDYFFSARDTLPLVGIDRAAYGKLFLWMPTFRVSKDGRFRDAGAGGGSLPVIKTRDGLASLDRHLASKRALLVIKVHPLAALDVGGTRLTNIRFVRNGDLASRGVRLYEFVKEFDALVTDYSSVFCDYLVLDRPMAFTLDDMEAYGGNRGFIFPDIAGYMPGHHVRTLDGLLGFIDACVAGRDPHAGERRRMLPFFCKYADGNNCRRLLEEVGITL